MSLLALIGMPLVSDTRRARLTGTVSAASETVWDTLGNVRTIFSREVNAKFVGANENRQLTRGVTVEPYSRYNYGRIIEFVILKQNYMCPNKTEL